jgi:endonuclease/exonuclease/phosphatase family metal-dependent hydrolase
LKLLLKKILIWSNIIIAICLFLSCLANFISPANIWVIAFFGLGFPIFVLLNIGFVFFWSFRKNMFFMISLIVLVAGWEDICRFVQIKPFYKTPAVHSSLKIISFNVRTFNQYNWIKGYTVRDSILSFLSMEQPDVVFFQDYYTNEANKFLSKKHIDQKLTRLAYSHLNFTSHSSRNANYGLATYSRFPIINKGSINFDKSFNSCIFSDIVIKSDTIRFYNVHFESIRLRKPKYSFTDSALFSFNPNQIEEVKDISDRLKNAYIKRAQQVDQVSRHISKSPYKVIVCGDFNDTPVSYTYQKVRGNLADAFMESGEGIGNTYQGSFPSFRIDYILHSRELKSYNYQTKHIVLSDHYPVSCNIKLN